MRFRLRTKFLLSMVLVSTALTMTSLLVVRRTVEEQVRGQINQDLRNSVLTFDRLQHLRQQTMGAATRLMADTPLLRALMTTEDAPTIQDASGDFWRLADSDVLVLANTGGEVMAIHSKRGNSSEDAAVQAAMRASLKESSGAQWWSIAGRLYQVWIQPIYFGTASEDHRLGYVAVGYEIDNTVARELSEVAASQVAFSYAGRVVRSTLPPEQERQLDAAEVEWSRKGGGEIQLAGEHFLAQTMNLTPPDSTPVRLVVLKSVDQATAVLTKLDQLILTLGILAVIAGSLLVFLISRTFTTPLERLVRGVRALGRGDYNYPLQVSGRDEVAELTTAFGRMRSDLQDTQRQLLEAERLATIGQMASSISHDLRHHLAAVVANSEFLAEQSRTDTERQLLYDEVRTAVNQMTDLMDSLVEFSRTSASLRTTHVHLRDVVERAVQTVRGYTQHHTAPITIHETEEPCEGNFDALRLQRVFQNLLLNACEACSQHQGKVEVYLERTAHAAKVRIVDNGRGVPPELRARIFDPFVSHGKENGTGLGLTVVQKIVQDHGGQVTLEENPGGGTVFTVDLPLDAGKARKTAAEPLPARV